MKLKDRTHDFDNALGETIKTIRKAEGVSQETLAAALGITFQQVQKYEKGTNRVAFGTLVLIAGKLGLNPTQLFAKAMARYEGKPDADVPVVLPTEIRVNGPRVEITRNTDRPTSFMLSEGCARITTDSGEEIEIVRNATHPFIFEIRGEASTAKFDISNMVQEITLHVVRENAE